MIARLAGILTLALCAVPASAQEDCDDWNTGNFFATATAQTVTACLEAGADLNAIDDDTWWPRTRGSTPLHSAARYSRDRAVIAVLLAAGADVNARTRHGMTPLHAAVGANRNLGVVEELVAAGADLNARDGDGNTPLHTSWYSRDPSVVHLLLELGADRTLVNDSGQVADPTDCSHWNTEVFADIATADATAACLAAGVDVNARDEGGNTPLLLATYFWAGGRNGAPASEDPAVVTVLLEAGADVNARNSSGSTPLHHAAVGQSREPARDWYDRVENPAIVAALLAAGADANARTGDGGTSGRQYLPGTTPLHVAASMEGLQTVPMLLEAGADIHARDSDGDSPLRLAAGGGFRHPEILEILVAAGADVNDRNERGRSVLLSALGSPADRVVAVVRRLLDLGADIGAPDLLHEAARRDDNPELITVLVGAGVGVNARDDRGTTPLLQAVESKWPANVAALLEAGADVHAVTQDGDTPLHLAAMWPPKSYGRRDDPLEPDTLMVIALVAAGADIDARNNRGETPLHAATKNRHRPVADKLLALGADPGAVDDLGRAPRPPVCDWANRDFFRRAPLEGVLVCIQAGADVHARDERDETPLHLLVEYGSSGDDPAGIVTAFVEAGADPNARNLWGATPLHGAVGGSTDLAAALLDAGADVNARDNRGGTPLHRVAVVRSGESAASMVHLLVEAGADVHATDSGGRTALHRALQQDEPATVSSLIELGSDIAARDDSGHVANPTDCLRMHTATFFKLASIEVVAGCIEGGADVNARSEGRGGPLRPGSTPLHIVAAGAGDPVVVPFLLEAGADVNARDRSGYSPLHRAAGTNDNPHMITMLLDAGADVNAWATGFQIDWGYDYTPLHLAVRNENPAVTAALLEAGADINALKGRGTGTPLHLAAGSDSNPAVVALLIEAGADVNARAEVWDRCCYTTSRDRTPLHLAAKLNPVAFIMLLDAGADPTALDDYGKTPMDYARENEALRELEVVKRSGG
ncbi:MAG: ankyrin repeat domain-containing protein [Gemmatimonadota bacterium]|nr:ankyrin repeat domain-containing protein [Gemmatimonadota bacterium]